ncbi:hypothetical protein [Aquabacterium sp.]|uniref:hypothetical protein n=1 Tax=Aquabacterium sp. TaxID=1872578 RepID=UPI0027BA9C5C|nr:hypothetical protein [Aquabacterium sp.]
MKLLFRMRKPTLVISALLAVASAVHAALPALDMDLMQTIEDTNKSMASHIAGSDAAGSLKDAQELHELFGAVEAHYVGKGDAVDGVELSRKSLQLTKKIIEQVGSKDFTGASESATDLSRTCRACHTFYKQS